MNTWCKSARSIATWPGTATTCNQEPGCRMDEQKPAKIVRVCMQTQRVSLFITESPSLTQCRLLTVPVIAGGNSVTTDNYCRVLCQSHSFPRSVLLVSTAVFVQMSSPVLSPHEKPSNTESTRQVLIPKMVQSFFSPNWNDAGFNFLPLKMVQSFSSPKMVRFFFFLLPAT